MTDDQEYRFLSLGSGLVTLCFIVLVAGLVKSCEYCETSYRENARIEADLVQKGFVKTYHYGGTVSWVPQDK